MSRRVGSLLRGLLGPDSGSSAELLDECDLDNGVAVWASCDDPRRGIRLLGCCVAVDGVGGAWPVKGAVAWRGVLGPSSPSSMKGNEVVWRSSAAGVDSRLGGGELKPDLGRGASARRLVARWSSSDALELQLAFELERMSRDVLSEVLGVKLLSCGTGARPEPRFTPRMVSLRLGVEGASGVTSRRAAAMMSSSSMFSGTSGALSPLRGWPSASPALEHCDESRVAVTMLAIGSSTRSTSASTLRSVGGDGSDSAASGRRMASDAA